MRQVTQEDRIRTLSFYDRLFPPLELLRKTPSRADENAIIQKHVLMYAKQGQGKTEGANTIVAEAIRRYGADNVSCLSAKGEYFLFLMEMGWKPVLVNILDLEDITDVKFTSNQVRDFFRIRHKAEEKTGLRTGMVLVLISCHRFHDVPLGFRTDVDFILWKEAPSNPYDFNIVKAYIGQTGIQELQSLEGERDLYPELKGFAFLSAKRKRLGMIYLPKEPSQVLKDLEDGSIVIQEGEEGPVQMVYGPTGAAMVQQLGLYNAPIDSTPGVSRAYSNLSSKIPLTIAFLVGAFAKWIMLGIGLILFLIFMFGVIAGLG